MHLGERFDSILGKRNVFERSQIDERIALMRARCRRQKGQASLADGG